MDKLKVSPTLLIGLLIAAFFGISLVFRVTLPYNQIFSGEGIKFSSIDAYFHMRLVDNYVSNFPHLTSFDPYFIYPGIIRLAGNYFFDWLISIVILIIGLGSPTQHVIDVVGVYFPPILAALTVIPVYFIGKTLFNRWVGVLAAGLIAVFPGEYLGRSILGFTDHHVAETLFSTTAILFLILAIKEAGRRELTLSHIVQRDWKTILRPIIYCLLSGVFMGIYLITWQGGLLFIFIISLYMIIQFIIDHLRNKPVEHLGISGGIIFLITLIIFLAVSEFGYITVSLIFALIIPLVLMVVSRVMIYKQMKPPYYPLALVGIGIIAVVIFYFIKPDMLRSMLAAFSIFNPAGSSAATTLEMQPFLSPQGSFSTLVAWGNYTTSFFLAPWWIIFGFGAAALCGLIYRHSFGGSYDKALLIAFSVAVVTAILAALIVIYSSQGPKVVAIPGLAFIALVIVIWAFIRQRRDDNYILLFLIWTLIMLVATLVQRRFAYYLVVNFALLSAYLSWQVIRLAGLRKLGTKPEEKAEKEQYYLKAPEKRDYYEILGLARSASNKEIRKAFRELSFAYHPDRNRTPEAEEKFKEINKAYEVLSNLERRANYDRSIDKIAERKKIKRYKEGQGITIYYVNTILAIIMVFVLVFLFNIIKAKDVASAAQFAPSDAWQSSLSWMKENTPEPYDTPDVYYQLHDPPPPIKGVKKPKEGASTEELTAWVNILQENANYPESTYGVLSWWDYGYWITRIAHRLPNANPSQDPVLLTLAARFFSSQEEASTREIVESLDTSYVIIDYAMVTTKYWAMINWSGLESDEFIGTYYVPYNNQLTPVQLFHPGYYRSLCVRLYNFNGEAVTKEKPMVISYDEKVDNSGYHYKQISNIEEFSSYQEALDYIESEGASKHRIVGVNPFISPVSLEPVSNYRLVYSSETGVLNQDAGMIPEVKIFEYLGD